MGGHASKGTRAALKIIFGEQATGFAAAAERDGVSGRPWDAENAAISAKLNTLPADDYFPVPIAEGQSWTAVRGKIQRLADAIRRADLEGGSEPRVFRVVRHRDGSLLVGRLS